MKKLLGNKDIKMKKTILSIAFAAAAFGADMQLDGFSYPESVLVDGSRVAVSNIGAKPAPMDKDGDGFISLLNKKGEMIDKNFITGLNAPKGMAFIRHGFGGTLYVADVDEVKGFDSNSKKQVFSLAFEGTRFLNDITVKDNNTLYVSGTDSGKIYEVDIKAKTHKVIADLPTANGVIYEDGKLYAVTLAKNHDDIFTADGQLNRNGYGSGALVEIDPSSGKVTQLATANGILDGIQKVGDTIYFSDWVKFEKAGVIRTYNVKTKEEGVLDIEKMAGPADFWIDKKDGKIWIPKMLEGKVLVTDLKAK